MGDYFHGAARNLHFLLELHTQGAQLLLLYYRGFATYPVHPLVSRVVFRIGGGLQHTGLLRNMVNMEMIAKVNCAPPYGKKADALSTRQGDEQFVREVAAAELEEVRGGDRSAGVPEPETQEGERAPGIGDRCLYL